MTRCIAAVLAVMAMATGGCGGHDDQADAGAAFAPALAPSQPANPWIGR